MKPTPKLRFVERVVEVYGDHKPVRVLQQWWQNKWYPLIGEWRDVPLEQE